MSIELCVWTGVVDIRVRRGEGEFALMSPGEVGAVHSSQFRVQRAIGPRLMNRERWEKWRDRATRTELAGMCHRIGRSVEEIDADFAVAPLAEEESPDPQVEEIDEPEGDETIDLSSMTNKELRAECEARGLPVYGAKGVLTQRLLDHEAE